MPKGVIMEYKVKRGETDNLLDLVAELLFCIK